MSGKSIFHTAVAFAALFLATVAPVTAQDIPAVSPLSSQILLLGDDTYEQDIASLVSLTEGNKRRAKPTLRTLLRRAERDWPRLMLRYAQPAVRGLLSDRQTGSNTLAIRTTLFQDNVKGLHLAGGLARNSWGEREARLQFSARF